MNFCGMCGEQLVDHFQSSTKKICPKCAWKWYDYPVPVVVVLVTTEDGNMVYVRKNDYPKNKWAIVSGYVGKNETAEEAALREVKEETGLDTVIVNYLGTKKSRRRMDELYILLHSRVIGGQLIAGDDADEVEIAPIELGRLIEGSISYQLASHLLSLQSQFRHPK